MSTMDFYNDKEKAARFAELSLGADMGQHYAHFLPLLPEGGRILDLGCGSGRDSRIFLELGFDVEATDGSEELCRLASEHIGKPVRCLDFRNLDYCGEFDGIWASASLLHLRSAETNGVLRKTAAALKNGGVLYASWKYGSGEKYRDERFYSDYTENDIPALLEGTKLTLREYWISEDVRADRANELWLNLICVKAEA